MYHPSVVLMFLGGLMLGASAVVGSTLERIASECVEKGGFIVNNHEYVCKLKVPETSRVVEAEKPSL